MKKMLMAAGFAALLTGCGGGGGDPAAGNIEIVGSSTVYPFTTAVAEQFERANPGTSVIVESTGTGSGMKLFCEGLGSDFPDVVNASRRMKQSEYEQCLEAGVDNVVELAIGIDGLTLIQGADEEAFSLTTAQVYEALAANPYGGEQTAENWSDIDPSLPDRPILVYGPPPTSGTRDSFAELILADGCDSNPEMQALKEEDEDRHTQVCTKIREDGVYVEAGENDNLLVQKVSQEAGAVGILGFSFLEENQDRVSAITLNGVMPDADNISSLEYVGARLLYIYVKGQHVTAKPALREFITAYKNAWQPEGRLARAGLVPLNEAGRAEADAAADSLTPVTPGALD
ncbi:substrate-binding domain-containing protein [Sphingomicrobium sp. XHP0239]|uniref:substrate-binding domain-containing protein n=1 Tax=Sphingomicrobium maritimum TaxID=3133972 RepID=UPI0031CC66C1